ncbi:MAG: superoxide dismutase [Anaerolineae bacterium]|nr:superoxide dismutase [Anaerolineae bacterium]
MKVLALEREAPQATAEAFRRHLRAEARQVWALVQQGVVREIYFRADQHTAVLVLECDDAAAARAILDTLPLVQAGLIDFEIIALAPYDGFARLFETG